MRCASPTSSPWLRALSRPPLRRLLLATAAALALLLAPPAAAATGPALTVDPSADRHPIAPEIYGMSFADAGLARELALPLNLTLRAPLRGRRIRSARVVLGGPRARGGQRLSGRRLSRPVVIRRLPRGGFTVTIHLRLAGERGTRVASRRYARCR